MGSSVDLGVADEQSIDASNAKSSQVSLVESAAGRLIKEGIFGAK